MITSKDLFSYEHDPKYATPVTYFSMEFAIDQALKIYSGGLGFLAGSHLRSAYELKQNLIGIGLLWRFGYYNQGRDEKNYMKPYFVEKTYSFLKDTGIKFSVIIQGAPVHVKVWLLEPETFKSAPLFLLSTELEENTEWGRAICHRLYDADERLRIAQSILLGTGGAQLLDIIGRTDTLYHMNEGHSVSLNFYLYSKFKDLEEVKKRVVFTTHTPEAAGNEEHAFNLLQDMSFFYGLGEHDVRQLLGMEGNMFNYTLGALRFAKKANAVSKLHGEVSREMWKDYKNICEITSITNAQNKTYWKDPVLEAAFSTEDDNALLARKKEMKKALFAEVADQTGKIFDENVLTIVWARRFAGYKRADLLMRDWNRFLQLLNNAEHPIQVIWAGKPYPFDYGAIDIYNSIIRRSKDLPNCAVVTGYELKLSALLKKGSDLWLNNPRMFREASGTSGMTAAINGSVNLSIPDGWIPEFAKDNENCFLINPAPQSLSHEEVNNIEAATLYELLEKKVVPMYYEDKKAWLQIMKNAAADVAPAFESGRMADEYYKVMFTR